MVQLGLLYKNSKLYQNDYNYEKAVDLFTRASNLGNVDSVRYFGNMYSRAFQSISKKLYIITNLLLIMEIKFQQRNMAIC